MRVRGWWMVFGLALGSLALGCAEPTAGGGARRSTLSIDLAGVRGTESGAVSVASRIVLTVTPDRGAPQTFTAELARGAFGAEFPVEVSDGMVNFGVEVFNGEDLLLLAGDSTIEIRRDGF